jgi:sugar transferase (PEP-CTERM system associated)
MSNPLLYLLGGDLLIAYAAFALGALLRYGRLEPVGLLMEGNALGGLLLAVSGISASGLLGLYRRGGARRLWDLLAKNITAGAIMFVLLGEASYLFQQPFIERLHLLASCAVFSVLQFLWHRRCHFVFDIAGLRRRVVVLGDGTLATQVGNLMSSDVRGEHFLGYLVPEAASTDVPQEQVLGEVDRMIEIVRENRANQIVIALSERRGCLPVRELLSCKLGGTHVVDAVSYVEEATGKLMLEHISPSWFVFSTGSRITPAIRFTRRAVDIFFSTVGILIAAPLLPIIALAVRLDSPGPVFFRQWRVGEGERNFLIYKFRTMRQDAEAGTGAVWAVEGDTRVTRVGKFLRKSRLDEIPQLFNVLSGDMSFVGPRPERPEFVEMLKQQVPYYGNRHSIKPGVTGWAQVRYPYGASVEDALAKLRYDLFYIKNYTLTLDLIIIVDTVRVVLFGKGGR